MALKKSSAASAATQADEVLSALKKLSVKRIRDEMAPRYGVVTDKAFGVSMANMKLVAKRFGRSHELAAALWKSGWYEARMVAAMIDEPDRVTAAQMERWCKDFDNWGICDTVCFVLFDRTPHAWAKVASWHDRREEFVKRTAYALLWSLTTHDKIAGDEQFKQGLKFIEHGAKDERHFVKKAVNMALRAVGKRNAALNAAAIETAQRLAGSADPAPRWVGQHALREIAGPKVQSKFTRRAK